MSSGVFGRRARNRHFQLHVSTQQRHLLHYTHLFLYPSLGTRQVQGAVENFQRHWFGLQDVGRNAFCDLRFGTGFLCVLRRTIHIPFCKLTLCVICSQSWLLASPDLVLCAMCAQWSCYMLWAGVCSNSVSAYRAGAGPILLN